MTEHGWVAVRWRMVKTTVSRYVALYALEKGMQLGWKPNFAGEGGLLRGIAWPSRPPGVWRVLQAGFGD